MKIIGYHASENCLYASDGWTCNERPISSLIDRGEEGSIHIACHLDYLAAIIFKIVGLTDPDLRKINDIGEIAIPPYVIKYIPGKFFSIGGFSRNDHRFISISDANQYRYWNFKGSIEEGVSQATRTGEEVYKAMTELGLSPTNLISPIRCWEKEKWGKDFTAITVDDMPEMASEYAYQCCLGNWLELYKKGHFPVTYDYDIKSAYAHIAAEFCLDTTAGEWIESDRYQEESYYGYCKGTVTITSPFSPIMYANKGRSCPMGTWERTLTKGQIDYIRKRKIGTFEIENGVWWRPDTEIRPLKNVIYKLYADKERATDPFKREIAKRILNGGFYGKFIQITHTGNLGDHMNPVWAAEIETRTQLRLAETCIANAVMPIAIIVDGILSDRKLQLIDGKSLGSWKLSSQGAALAISTGIMAIEGKSSGKDFSLDYDWLMDQIKQDPDAEIYVKYKQSPVTLAKACNENRLQDIGKIEEITRTIDIGYELKRAYSPRPKTGKDLLSRAYDSFPHSTSTLIAGDYCNDETEMD